MESVWSGSVEGAFFDPDQFERCRTLFKAQTKYESKPANAFYVLGVDVGRKGCNTEVIVMRVRPGSKASRATDKDIVNIISLDDEHFAVQALTIKKIFKKYKCTACVLDGNGLTY